MQIKNLLLRISCTTYFDRPGFLSSLTTTTTKKTVSFVQNMAVKMGTESIKYVIKIIYLPIHSPDSQFVSSCMNECAHKRSKQTRYLVVVVVNRKYCAAIDKLQKRNDRNI